MFLSVNILILHRFMTKIRPCVIEFVKEKPHFLPFFGKTNPKFLLNQYEQILGDNMLKKLIMIN